MKRLLSPLILLGLVIPFSSSAAVPDFLAFNDSSISTVEVISDNQKVNSKINLGFKTGPNI